MNGSWMEVKIKKGERKKINRFWVCNKKHFRNDILHSIIIKWSMFMWIFSIPFLHARFFLRCALSIHWINYLFIFMYFSITFHPISFTIISSYMLFFVFCLFQIISQEINGFFASSLLLVLSTQRSSTSEWSSSFFWSLLLSFFALLSYPQTHSNLPSIVFFFCSSCLIHYYSISCV